MSLLLSFALAGTTRFALLAGSNDGGPERVQLQYAVEDAQAMARVLQELGGVRAEDTLLLADPSPDELDAGLALLDGMVQEAAARGDRTEVLVYYSGHSDEAGLRLTGEHYGYDTLRTQLDSIDSDVRILVLDSCSSGAVVRSKGGSFGAPFLVDESVDVEGHAYLTSSASDEVAQEADRIGGSYFTHYLVTGLRGAADTSDDGRVTLNEAYNFAYSETLRGTERTVGGAQHPTYDIQLSGTGDLVMTDLSSTSASLVVQPSIEGRLSIRDDQGRLVAELYKPAGRPISLGLPPGRYTLLLDQEGVLSEAVLDLAEGQSLELLPEAFSGVDAQVAVARGDAEYVTVPIALGLAPALILGGDKDFKQLHRVDIALIATNADALEGVQLSMVGNLSRDWTTGLQAAVGGNNARRLTGAQLSVGLNVAQGPSRGMQAVVGLNVANELTGVQLSSGLNLAGSLKGAQIGLVNIGGRTNAQIGLLNIARDADVSIGLLSINLAGYNTLQVWAGESDPARLTLTYGGKRFYSLVELGARNVDVCQSCVATRLTVLLGLGWHSPLGERLYLDADAASGSYYYGLVSQDEPGLLVRGRAVLGFEIIDQVAVFGGPSLTLLPATFGVDYGPTWVPQGSVGGLPAWPGLGVGIRVSGS